MAAMERRNWFGAADQGYDAGWKRAQQKGVANAYANPDPTARADALARQGFTEDANAVTVRDRALKANARQDNVRSHIATGDYAGAETAAEGDPALLGQADEVQQQKAKRAIEQAHVMQGVFTRLADLPDDQQQAAFSRALPQLQAMGINGLDKVEFGRAAMLQQAQAMGLSQEKVKEQLFNLGNGRGVAAVNPETGAGRMAFAPEPDPAAQDMAAAKLEAERALAEQRRAAAGKARRGPAVRAGGGKIPPLPPGFVMEK